MKLAIRLSLHPTLSNQQGCGDYSGINIKVFDNQGVPSPTDPHLSPQYYTPTLCLSIDKKDLRRFSLPIIERNNNMLCRW
jgi:hypothetical protein